MATIIKRLGILVLVLMGSTPSMALDAVLGHTVFYSADLKQTAHFNPSVEAYWQINPASLRYIRTAQNTLVARIKTDIVISNAIGIIKEDHFILYTVPRATVQEVKSHSIIELRRYPVITGTLKLTLTLTDLADSTKPVSYTDTFTVFEPARPLYYSNLQLLDTVIPSTAQTNFLKNGVQQVPSCSNFIDEYKHNLHYYAELYKTGTVEKTTYPLFQTISISKSEDGDEFGNFIKRDTFRSEPPVIISGSFPINALPSGNFYLKISISDKIKSTLSSQTYFFQRLNKHPVSLTYDSVKKTDVSDTGLENVTVLNLKKTFIAKYTLGETKAILKMILPFSDPIGAQTINGFLKKPDELYMRYYIYNFFAAINKKDPGRAFKEFSNKIIDVNKKYTSRGKPGYETERGIIYLKYGAPTDIVTVVNENGSLPFEIWQYNVLTQLNHKEITDALFLFYKQNQTMGDFRLLHSTVDGEAKNLDWRAYLFPSGTNPDSRAEQTLGNR